MSSPSSAAADSDSFTAVVCSAGVELSSPAAPPPPTNLDSQDLIAVQSSQRRETRQSLKHGTTHVTFKHWVNKNSERRRETSILKILTIWKNMNLRDVGGRRAAAEPRVAPTCAAC